MDAIKVLAFDTGGSILDWHGGIVAALAECGDRRGVTQDWHEFAMNTAAVRCGGCWGRRAELQHRRRASRGARGAAARTRHCAFSDEDRRMIASRCHQLDAWPDFVPALTSMRWCYLCVSFTILSLSLVIDVSRRNGIDWDAVICCEMLGVYKPHD